MKKYRIENIGCDDTTYTEMLLTKEELETLVKFALENNKNSKYGCQPKITISVIEEVEEVIKKENIKVIIDSEEENE